jgi:hypothetical protein
MMLDIPNDRMHIRHSGKSIQNIVASDNIVMVVGKKRIHAFKVRIVLIKATEISVKALSATVV